MNVKSGMGEMLTSFLPVILIFIVFYFFLIRPQQKKAKEHAKMIEAIQVGQSVITNFGMTARISKLIDDKYFEVEISSGVKVVILRSVVADVLNDNVMFDIKQNRSSCCKKSGSKCKSEENCSSEEESDKD
ncbi:preprotein translocase subunit YajC [Candidatus Gromoviella agglomerans]|uniref:preprotein translocase subunit YajC n=1 Tax=Candidatus Gromoviella agglomerans TaxID=2806609 RepID=UPI001E3BEF2C|nr:preprotein translocase subunit YajC [Candidatus Gromoviella agglomerans]UFX98347.1 Preprotein translocase subunit YajC [Candidatus Gromoviella agglomerans]